MPNMELAESIQGCDWHGVQVVQRMACVEAHACVDDPATGLGDERSLGQCLLRVGWAMLADGFRPWASVDFTHVKAAFGSRVDLIIIWVNEGAGWNACVIKLLDDVAESRPLTNHIEATLGRDFLATFGHQHGRVRPDLHGDGDHFVRCGHFKIEGHFQDFLDPRQICVLNMTPVFA